eukprot:11917404-Ditylum_brightwellii.AAC.1
MAHWRHAVLSAQVLEAATPSYTCCWQRCHVVAMLWATAGKFFCRKFELKKWRKLAPESIYMQVQWSAVVLARLGWIEMLLVMALQPRKRAHQQRSLPEVGLQAPQPFVAQIVVAMLSLSSWQHSSRCMSGARRRIWQMLAASLKSLMERLPLGLAG